MNSISHSSRRAPAAAPVLLPLLFATRAALAQDGGEEPTPIDLDHIRMEEMTVVATPLDTSVKQLTQGVTILQGEALSRAVSNTIGETLAAQPGVTASYFGAGSSRPVIRGLGGPRVRVMEDGIASLDVSTVSVDHAVGVEPLLVERVEVLRGPNTLLYGSGAVGGVVNTITTRLPTDQPEPGVRGRVELRGDTVADQRTGAFDFNGTAGQFAFHVDGLVREQDDYELSDDVEPAGDLRIEDGRLANSDLESNAYGAGVTWFGERAFFGVTVSGFETNYGVQTVEEEEGDGDGGEEEEGEENIRIDLEQTRVDLKGRITPAGGFFDTIEMRAAWNDYRHVELEGAKIGTRFDNDALEARLEMRHRQIGAWDGAFGVQLELRDFAAVGAEAFVPPVETTRAGLFLVEERGFGQWLLSLGGRAETQRQDSETGLEVEDSAFSASAGLVREIGAADAVALNLSFSQRLPDAEELFSDGPHLATSSFEIGDPDLGVETSQHLELSWRHDGERVSFALTGFVTRFDDFIYLVETGEIEDGLDVFQWTQGDADFAGVEAEVEGKLFSVGRGEIDLRVFGDYVSGQLSDGENLPRISPARLGARLEYHDSRLTAGLETTHTFEQDQVAVFETATDGFTMLDADLNWNLAVDERFTVDLFLRASNLLDQDARRHVSFVKDLAPLPGRNFAFGIRSRF